MFSHENLRVYKESVSFVKATHEVISAIPKKTPVRDQLERASTSIPLNIAEGNGKFTAKDKCRFLDIARGSAMECAACMDVMVAQKMIDKATGQNLKSSLDTIVSMLVCMIRSISKERNH